MFSVLIVEDDQFMLDSLATILQEEGYETLKAENGQRALEVLKEGPSPDLILLDMIMPVMNGWDFATAYRQEFNSETPIIVISGAADVAKRAEDIKADACLPKPYDLNEILQLIRSYFLKKKQ